MPFDSPLMATQVEIDYDGVAIQIDRDARYRYVDDVYGEQWSFVKAVPGLSVRLTPETGRGPDLERRQERVHR